MNALAHRSADICLYDGRNSQTSRDKTVLQNIAKTTFYNAFNVYRRELAPGTVSLTGDRAQGDDSKHWAYSIYLTWCQFIIVTCSYI